MGQAIRIRSRREGGFVNIQVLMPHPMETGMRQDEGGRVVPAHHICDVWVTLDDREVFAARMSIAVSRDPLLNFRVSDARPGQRLRVSWRDNQGQTRSDDSVVA